VSAFQEAFAAWIWDFAWAEAISHFPLIMQTGVYRMPVCEIYGGQSSTGNFSGGGGGCVGFCFSQMFGPTFFIFFRGVCVVRVLGGGGLWAVCVVVCVGGGGCSLVFFLHKWSGLIHSFIHFNSFPRHQPAYQVLKTICSNIWSSAPEDGHNDARNMLS